ncbi:hypothetical protein SDC9_121028 [bioreactor metagenome]|uniref:Uncharacterized protein n=1 Tax=bioreactor metagenome TaxID=1076179 RepID=A0A645CAT1_9ZZZZ
MPLKPFPHAFKLRRRQLRAGGPVGQRIPTVRQVIGQRADVVADGGAVPHRTQNAWHFFIIAADMKGDDGDCRREQQACPEKSPAGDPVEKGMHGNVPEYPEITEQHRNVKKVKQVLRRKKGEYRLRDLSHLRGKPEVVKGKEVRIVAHVQNVGYHQRRQHEIQQQRKREASPVPEERRGKDQRRRDRQRGGDGKRHARDRP